MPSRRAGRPLHHIQGCVGTLILLVVATLCASVARAGESWSGTWNAPHLWRMATLEWTTPDGAPRLAVGDASRRLELRLGSYTASDDSLFLVADLAGATVALAGARDGDTITGSLEVRLGADVLTQGTWSMRRYRSHDLSAAEILARVRNAMRLTAEATTAGFTIAQAADPQAEPTWLAGAAPGGRIFVMEDGVPELGSDGSRLWAVRAPLGRVSSDRRTGEKLLLAAVVRSGAWLLPESPFACEALATGAPDSGLAVLTLRREHGVVPARIFIDPRTWLPVSAEVEWDAEPYRLEFSDYRSCASGFFPQQCRTSYRGNGRNWTTVEVRSGADAPLVPAVANVVLDQAAAPYLAGRTAPDNGHLFVRPQVNGRDVGWFHIDSGAPFVILDTSVADSLGLAVLHPAGPRSFRRVDELRVGQLVLRDLMVMVADLSDASSPAGEHRAGVIGGPVFANAVVEFDYTGRRLGVFAPDALPIELAGAGTSWLPLQEEGGPVVEIKLASGAARVVLDTGKSGTASFTSQAALDHGLLTGPDLGLADNQTVAGTTIERVTRIPFLELAGRRFADPEVRTKFPGTPNDDVNGVAGAIGRGFFGDRRLVFDYARGRFAIIEGR